MTDVIIETKIFNDVYLPYLEDITRTQIFYGGSSSGKSKFLAQRTVHDLMKGKRNYLVTRKVARTLRGSVFTEVCKVIREWDVSGLFNINKSDMVITCTNGYQVIFAGLDDVEKLKSLTTNKGVITDIWGEEATEYERADLKQLFKRQRGGDESVPKRITLSFNPILQTHFIYTDYFSTVAWSDSQTQYHGDDLSILKTTYKDNRFLTKQDVEDLENEIDPYYRDVYTLGNWGVLGNVIFKNWRVDDLSGMTDQFTNRRIGLDFGFSDDPAAMPITHYDSKRKIIYVYDELYERGLTNDVLAREIKTKIGNDILTADSSEPKSIQEIVNEGISAKGARKGKDSVLFGIQWLQQQEIIIDSKCINTRNEFQSYKWKEDKDGNAIRQPVDHNNHIIDALRYAYEDESAGGLWWVS
jgi:phage terminase large subunit